MRTRDSCSHTWPSAQKVPALGLINALRHHLENLNLFLNKGALSFHFALTSANYVAGPAYKTYMWKQNVSVEYRSKCPRLGFQHEQGGVRESGAWRGGVQGERQLENDGEYCKNKITKREAGSKGKIEQEIKIYI